MRRIYGKGDKGRTDLLGKGNVSKASLRVSCYGEIDELSSFIGLARVMLTERDSDIRSELMRIQERLFRVGAELAAVDPSKLGIKLISEDEVSELEELISRYESTLPALKNFIYPGGSQGSAYLHVARAIARRAERGVVGLSEREPLNPNIIRYLNRLSTVLFIFARVVAHRDGNLEERWLGRLDEI